FVVHSCWCILLNECGLNSNLHLNSNLFELGIEKEIEKETNPNPIPEAHQLNPGPVCFPLGPTQPLPAARRLHPLSGPHPHPGSSAAQRPARQPAQRPFPRFPALPVSPVPPSL